MKAIEDRARFDFVRYANCWEDADVLLKALAPREGGRYLSIASAGDNCLALLSASPAEVLAVDLNRAQLACLDIRRAAFSLLSHGELLAFLGVRSMENRRQTYQTLRNILSPAAMLFWDARLPAVEEGIIFYGKFENYFKVFRDYALPFIHQRKTVARLLTSKTRSEREMFYDEVWDTWRWRALFRLFFSRRVMGRFGRDPEFFRYVEGNVAGRILQRTRHALTVLETHSNPYLTFILTGHFGQALPFYLRRENFEAIRRNLSRLRIVHGSVDDALSQNSRIRFHGFNLSDIFEYMDETSFKGLLQNIRNGAEPGARLAYWNMLVDRQGSDHFAGNLRPLTDLANALFHEDKAFFYKRLVVEEVSA